MHVRYEPRDSAEHRQMRQSIDESRRKRREPGPAMNVAHRIACARAQPSFVIVREKLGLVSRHIDLHGTLALASLTRQTQIERFLDCFALPAVADRFAPDHLAEQTRTAARRVLLLERDHVARTHRAAAMTPAHTRADATLGRFGEAVFVVR